MHGVKVVTLAAVDETRDRHGAVGKGPLNYSRCRDKRAGIPRLKGCPPFLSGPCFEGLAK